MTSFKFVFTLSAGLQWLRRR